MKKIALSLIGAVFVMTASASSAQNNTPWTTSGSIGIGTTNPARTLDVFGQARATYLWAGQNGANQDGRLYITDANGNVKIYLGGYPSESSFFATGNVGIGTVSPSTLLQVVGPITAGAAGGSTLGVDYLYGNYSNGKLFVLGSQYSTAASFMAYAVKAQPGATGYLSSTGITLGRSSIEANNGYLSFLTGAQQASSDGGTVSISEKMRIDASGNVGVGTSTPVALIDAVSMDNLPSGTIAAFEANNRTSAIQLGYNRITQVNSNPSSAYLRLGVSNFPDSVFINPSGNVGIGTTDPTQKLSVNGTIRAKEVIVETTGWSDYVFADNYSLAPLSEVEQHIKAEKRLPGIPSSQEVIEQGISVGQMQAKLLAKIEELTLHVIAQEKRISSLEAENVKLRK